jgi:hypothetical protein
MRVVDTLGIVLGSIAVAALAGVLVGTVCQRLAPVGEDAILDWAYGVPTFWILGGAAGLVLALVGVAGPIEPICPRRVLGSLIVVWAIMMALGLLVGCAVCVASGSLAAAAGTARAFVQGSIVLGIGAATGRVARLRREGGCVCSSGTCERLG